MHNALVHCNKVECLFYKFVFNKKLDLILGVFILQDNLPSPLGRECFFDKWGEKMKNLTETEP